jgi:hypothetical protein
VVDRHKRLTNKETEELKRLRKEDAGAEAHHEILGWRRVFRPGGRPDPTQIVTFVKHIVTLSGLRRCSRHQRTSVYLLRQC